MILQGGKEIIRNKKPGQDRVCSFHFEVSLSIRASVIPVDENPPSCMRFCMVMKMDGMEKVMLGLTDLKQVRAVCIK